MRAVVGRALHLLMGLYLAASAIVVLDDAGVGGDDSALSAAAEATRELSSGNDPFGVIEGIDDSLAAVRNLAQTFREAAAALDS